MPQVHFYVPKTVAEELQCRARSTGKSVSAYVAALVRSQLTGEWPEGYFESVVGGWRGEALERPPQPLLEERDPL